MSEWKKVKPETLDMNVFKAIYADWMLVTGEMDGKVNTMTASWGGMGIMWSANVAFVALRPQRYTKELVDGSDTLSLSFLPGEYKKELAYLGKVSGRDEDKVTKSGLTVAHDNGIPYFEEADMVMTCKKLFAQPYLPESFIEEGIIEKWYPEKDFHTLYIVEILDVLQKA